MQERRNPLLGVGVIRRTTTAQPVSRGCIFTLIQGLMFTLIRRFQGILFSNIQGEAGWKVTTEECEGEGDG